MITLSCNAQKKIYRHVSKKIKKFQISIYIYLSITKILLRLVKIYVSSFQDYSFLSY